MAYDHAPRRDHAPTSISNADQAHESNAVDRRTSAPAPSGGLFATLAPGRGTLVQPQGDSEQFGGWETLSPQELAGSTHGRTSSGGSSHRAPAKQVADASEDFNAVLRVVVYQRGMIYKTREVKAVWEGKLPATYTGQRINATTWTWSDGQAQSVKLDTEADGSGGVSVETWAGGAADKIVIYARAEEQITDDRDADENDHEPGDSNDKKNKGKPPTKNDAAGGRATEKTRGEATGKRGGKEGGKGKGEPRNEDHGPSPEDERLADEFERELGIFADDKQNHGSGHGTGKDPSNSDKTTGKDTGSDRGTERGKPNGSDHGKDSGSEHGKSNGQQGGSAERGGKRDGSAGGSKDGTKGGAKEGMFGGEGKAGDAGVPSAIGLFGGLLSVPASLRGLVEVALIISDGNLTGAGATAFKSSFKIGMKRLKNFQTLRKLVAREARVVAAQNTKMVIKKLATDKATAAAWAKLSIEEQKRIQRIVHWEMQRRFFDGYLKAAQAAKANATKALKKAPKSKALQQQLNDAELAELASEVKPVAGRLPINADYAGQRFPNAQLPSRYRDKGVWFTKDGFPDFEPWAKELPNGKKHVTIKYQGTRHGDFAEADRLAGYGPTNRRPAGLTWHHEAQPLGKMTLVPTDLHDAVKHTGGVATYKHVTGDVTSYAGER